LLSAGIVKKKRSRARTRTENCRKMYDKNCLIEPSISGKIKSVPARSGVIRGFMKGTEYACKGSLLVFDAVDLLKKNREDVEYA